MSAGGDACATSAVGVEHLHPGAREADADRGLPHRARPVEASSAEVAPHTRRAVDLAGVG